jgi:hypothetical protein
VEDDRRVNVILDYNEFRKTFASGEGRPDIAVVDSDRGDRLRTLNALHAAGWVSDSFRSAGIEAIEDDWILTVDVQPVDGPTIDFMLLDEEVNLAFDMEEVRDQAAVDAIAQALRTIGSATGKTVVITAECMAQPDPVVWYLPGKDSFEFRA